MAFKTTVSTAPVWLALVACVVSVASSAAQETAGALAVLRGRADEFCFGRTYDAAHMARHRQQRLSAFFLFRDFSPDPLSEDKPIPRERLIAIDKSSTHRQVDVLSRDRAGRVSHSTNLSCEESGGEFRCAGTSVDEDAVLEVRPSQNSLLVKNGLETGRYELRPQPIGTCLAWRDRARPSWVGKGPPLRVRFAEHAPACFMREYDERHLTRHPNQNVVGVTVRINGPVEIDESDLVRHTMLRVTLSLKLRDGSLTIRNTRCDGSGYDFWCQHGQSAVHLAPAGDSSIMMFERTAGEHRGKSPMAAFFGMRLGRGDQAFRLDARSDTACELR
jgi:hypothetical protein